MASVEIRDARKAFGAVEILHGVNVGIEDGQFVVLVGPSGCGKSTLISAIAGLTRLSAGELLVGDLPVLAPGAERGVVFQHHTLFPWKTVFQNVEFGLKNRGVRKSERILAVREMLAAIGR